MAGNPETPEKIALARILYLNAKIHGIVSGLVAGLGLFVATNWLVLKGGPIVGPHLALLGEFFPGYRVTFLGSFIGFAYAFVCGCIIGYSVAGLYNWIAFLREPTGSNASSEQSHSKR
jgi:hypothetical protein